MNRFEFAVAQLTENESVVMKDEHIKIYDGQEKVSHLNKNSDIVYLLFLFCS